MKQKNRLIVLLLGGALLLCLTMEACAPKVYGARPHRRDRHCGCENKDVDAPTENYYLTENQINTR